MLAPLLLGLTIVATPPADHDIAAMDDQPRITISLKKVDLANAAGLRRVEQQIHHAAISVCDRGYRGLTYDETVACVKSAIADGNAQLSRIVTHEPSGTPVTAAIAVTAPSN